MSSDLSGLWDALARIVTVGGSVGAAYVTARFAVRGQEVAAEVERDQRQETSRRESEDQAYERAAGYYKDALADARRELAETQQELAEEKTQRRADVAEERRQRREETDALNQQLGEQREQIARLRARLGRAEEAARRIARTAGQPDPDL